MKTKIFIFFFLFWQISFAKFAYNYELRTAPVALIARWLTLDYSLTLNDHWAAGPSVILYAAPKVGNMFTPSYNGSAWGMHIYYYFDQFSENGWYWGHHFYYENYDSYVHNLDGHYQFKGFKLNSKFGFQSIMPSGVNLLLGLGLEYRNYSQTNMDDSEGTEVPTFKDYNPIIPFVEIKMGYKF